MGEIELELAMDKGMPKAMSIVNDDEIVSVEHEDRHFEEVLDPKIKNRAASVHAHLEDGEHHYEQDKDDHEHHHTITEIGDILKSDINKAGKKSAKKPRRRKLSGPVKVRNDAIRGG